MKIVKQRFLWTVGNNNTVDQIAIIKSIFNTEVTTSHTV